MIGRRDGQFVAVCSTCRETLLTHVTNLRGYEDCLRVLADEGWRCKEINNGLHFCPGCAVAPAAG